MNGYVYQCDEPTIPLPGNETLEKSFAAANAVNTNS